MTKRKRKFLQYLKWIRNKQLKIEKQKRRKNKRGAHRHFNTGLRYAKDKIVIVFPEIIDLYNQKKCEETLNFFNREYNDLEKYKDGVIFNFSNVKEITLSGGILIRCFYDFLISKHTSIKCNSIKRDKIMQILFHIGVLKDRNIIVTHKDISRWTIQSWNGKELIRRKFNNELISKIIETTTGWDELSMKHKRLYEVVPEILYNCIQHAYAYNDDYSFQNFYLFSGIANRKYVFCVLDRGIGFKETYKIRLKGQLDFNNIENDGDYIKYSIQTDNSSFKIPGRGNGLFTLKENILNLKGAIFIHSYTGKITVSTQKGEIQSENRYPLLGSLVQFEVPIS